MIVGPEESNDGSLSSCRWDGNGMICSSERGIDIVCIVCVYCVEEERRRERRLRTMKPVGTDPDVPAAAPAAQSPPTHTFPGIFSLGFRYVSLQAKNPSHDRVLVFLNHLAGKGYIADKMQKCKCNCKTSLRSRLG